MLSPAMSDYYNILFIILMYNVLLLLFIFLVSTYTEDHFVNEYSLIKKKKKKKKNAHSVPSL